MGRNDSSDRGRERDRDRRERKDRDHKDRSRYDQEPYNDYQQIMQDESTRMARFNNVNTKWVRLKGLPYKTEFGDIEEFMSGCRIVFNGITLLNNKNGEAFVHMVDPVDVRRALCRHKKKLGSRYVEVFPSSEVELRDVINAIVQGQG